MRFTAQVYVTGGVLLMIDAFLAPYLLRMFESNPVQGWVFLAGETCVLIGFTALYAYRKRMLRIRLSHPDAGHPWRG